MATAGEGNDFFPPDPPTNSGYDDFILGEVLAPAESLEHAQFIAAAYGLELKSYAYGIAVLLSPVPEQAVAQSSRMRMAGVPALSLNWFYTMDEVDVTPLETSVFTGASRYRENEEGRFIKIDDAGKNDPWAMHTTPVKMGDGMYYYGEHDETNLGSDEPSRSSVEFNMDHWQHEVMDNERAWGLTTGAGVVVAVIDSGIHITHPAFAGRILPNSFNAYTNQVGLSHVQDDRGHGTHVSGIAAGAPTASSNISGVARNVQIMAIKANAPGANGFSSEALYRGINYAADNGAHIINMSLGRPYSNGSDTLERSTIANAVARGVTVVASAGNDSHSHAGYPAAYPEVIAVSSLRMKPTGPSFDGSYSNFGPEIDISAPGTDILASIRSGGYGRNTGTSMAAPNVAGSAALVKSLNPGFTPQQIRDRLNFTARQAGMLGGDSRYGYGIVSSYAALLGPGALHSVTYHFENGRNPITVLIAPGARLIEPARYVSGDQILMNWSTTPNGSLFDFDSPVTVNMNLYANWVEAEPVGNWVVEFPDITFRHAVYQLLADMDDVLRTDDSPMNTADTFLLGTIEQLELRSREGSEIKDMTGLRHFPELTHLNLNSASGFATSSHLMTSLDMSLNPRLQWLNIDNNESLRSLNLTNNPELVYLSAWQSQNIDRLDLSGNPALKELYTHGSRDGRIDLSNNHALSILWIGWSNYRLTELNLSNNPMLEKLSVGFHHLTEIELKNNTMLREVRIVGRSRLDTQFRLAKLDVSNNPLLEVLEVDGHNLASLDLSQNPKLFLLDASDNSLTSINVSNCPELAVLNVADNQLTALDVSNNPALGQLIIRNNQIAALDLSKNVRLGAESRLDIGDGSAYLYYGLLWADNNMLTTLDLSNTASNWNDPVRDGTIRLNLSGNYIPAFDKVIGWQGRRLVLEDNFIFDPQRISSPPSIMTGALPDGKVGVTYNQRLVATGGGITWSITGGSLPEGLALGSAGVISGIPLEDGTFEFTVAAANDAGSASVTLTMVISFAPVDGVVVWITNAEELAAIGGAQSKGRYFVLANDIYLDEEWVPIDDFRGILDGRGYSIHNLYVLGSSGRVTAGLFGSMSDADVTIKNLRVYIDSQGVTSASPLTLNAFAGGLVGFVSDGSLTVMNCCVEGNVFATPSGSSSSFGQGAGGLIGGAISGARITISTSFADSNVAIARGFLSATAGGLIGRGSGSLVISNSYATGNVVVAGSDASGGGLVGGGGITAIVNSYATGNVSAPVGRAGGIAGNIPRGSDRNSYRLDTQVVTGNVVNDLGIPLTEAQMRQQTSFVGWDFSSVWSIDEVYNDGLPYLRVFRRLAESDEDKLIEARDFITWPRIRGGNTLPGRVVTDLAALPNKGLYETQVEWESSNPMVVSNTGTVTRPAHGAGDAVVTLTATVKLNGLEDTVAFDLIIKEQYLVGGPHTLTVAGNNHSLAIKVDGSLWAWGYNGYGQLGNGTTANSLIPIQILDEVVSVAAGGEHSLAIKADGTLWAWGDNSIGQLGNNSTTTSRVPIKILDGVVGVAAGYNHSLAIKADGSLWAWGNNSVGQLGDGTTDRRLEPVKIMDNVVSVAAGSAHTLAVRADDSLWTWGFNIYGQLGNDTTTNSLVPIKILNDVVSAAAGDYHSMSITSNGSLWAWGYNVYGQLGDGTTTRRSLPVKITDGISVVTGGDYHTVAIKTDGSLCAWGRNNYGQLGDGTTINRHEPVNVMDGTALISAGSNHSLAVPSDGSLWAWGRNNNGQLGDGTTADSPDPIQIMYEGSILPYMPETDAERVALAKKRITWNLIRGKNDLPTNVISDLDVLPTTGAYDTIIRWQSDNTAVVSNAGAVTRPAHGFGDATAKLTAEVSLNGLSDNVIFSLTVKEKILVEGSYTLATAGHGHTLAIKVGGSLRAWGNNQYGQLGDGTSIQRLEPVKVLDMDDAVSVAAGQYHSLAVKADGSLWAWGSNGYGQLGLGDTTQRLKPEKVLDDVVCVAAGNYHSLAVKSDGSLWAWGNNYDGQLGDGKTTNSSTPVKVLDDVIFVVAGYAHTLAIKADGSLWAWGQNQYFGQLGDGSWANRLTPVKVLDDVRNVAAGEFHSLAVKDDGSLWGWGRNQSGELGIGNTSNRPSPMKIMDNVVCTAAGYYHSLAIKDDGNLWAWGDNQYGQLGDGTTERHLRPVKILDDSVLVASGDYYSLTVPSDGSLWAWGRNNYGQLGDGKTDNSSKPIQIMPAGSILPDTPGIVITGKVRTYNPGSPTTARLYQDGAVKYTTTIPATTGIGQAEQSFTFENVAPGTYTLVITKEAHTPFTVQKVVVDNQNVDLTMDTRPEVRLMTLRCGDINGDGMINDADLAILWLAANYNKSATAQGVNPRCDLNGDGMINDADLAILWLAVNYNKGAVVIPGP